MHLYQHRMVKVELYGQFQFLPDIYHYIQIAYFGVFHDDAVRYGC